MHYDCRIAQNVGGGKHWRIWRLSIDSPKFSHPNIVNTLKCNGIPTQFAIVLPSNYTSRVISPKFYPANILRYTGKHQGSVFVTTEAVCLPTAKEITYDTYRNPVLSKVLQYVITGWPEQVPAVMQP